jgi:HAMP domain-containing protein
MQLGAILVALLVGALTWWLLKRQLAPLTTAVDTLAAMADSDHPPQPIPVARRDEVGELIGGFNRLVGTLSQRETELKSREKRWQVLFDEAIDGF